MIGLEPVVRAYLAYAASARRQLDASVLAQVWPIVVGRVWAQRTRPRSLVKGRLDVAVPDAVWLQEMRFRSKAILERLNEILPESLPRVQTLRLVVASDIQWEDAHADAGLPVGEGKELTEEQKAAFDQVRDGELRELMMRVVRRSRQE